MEEFDDIFQDLARTLDQIFVQVWSLSFPDLEKMFHEVEADFVTRFTEAGRNDFAMETRRRVAERVLMSGIQKRLPVQKCRSFLDRMQQLGYTDDYIEMSCQIIFAQYLIRMKEVNAARQMLLPLSKRTFPPDTAGASFVETARDLLHDLPS